MFRRRLRTICIKKCVLRDMRKHGSRHGYWEAMSLEVLDTVLAALDCLQLPIAFSDLEKATDFTCLRDLKQILRALPEPLGFSLMQTPPERHHYFMKSYINP